MGNNFRTVQEITKWKNFIANGQTYDLSHLDAHWAEYFDDRDLNKPITYKFVVTYGFHCFTKASDDLTQEQSDLLMYHAPKESRPFNFERYYLSKQLPSIIKALGAPTTLVFHAGYGKYATVRVLDSNGIEVYYFVAFKVFREEKKLRLHVASAYPKYDGMGKIKKVKFLTIASNLLRNKKLPKP
ncbi:MAG: heat-shock protein [Waterburya sp.]